MLSRTCLTHRLLFALILLGNHRKLSKTLSHTLCQPRCLTALKQKMFAAIQCLVHRRSILFLKTVSINIGREAGLVEALSKIQGDLPASVQPQIGPDATGVGWVYQYALIDKSGKYDLSQLRSLQDWFLKFELATVSGVSEVASVGGFVKEYQVLIDPNRLRAFDIPLKRLMEAVRNASMDAGGRVIEKAEMELMIRSKGCHQSKRAPKNSSLCE